MSTIPAPPVVQRTDSEVSPKTTNPPRGSNIDYFPESNTSDGLGIAQVATGNESSVPETSISAVPDATDARNSSLESNNGLTATETMLQRKSSTSSVTFKGPRNPSLPQGKPQSINGERLRESSPPPLR